MNRQKESRDFLLSWNYMFPFDRLWRKRYNISFLSKEHLDSCQIDITLEFLEETLFTTIKEESIERNKNKTSYAKGILFKEESIEKDEKENEDAFFNLDIDKFNE